MVQEPVEVSKRGDENSVSKLKVAQSRTSKGPKVFQSKSLRQEEEEHWQWTSVKRKRSSVIHSHRSDVQEHDPPRPDQLITHIARSTLSSAPPRLESSVALTQGQIVPSDDFNHVEKLVAQSTSKCAVEVPRLELAKVKEIALQAKLEAGAYVCQECQAAVTTSRSEIGLHRRYPFLLYFCIFLNVMSILSFLFCISVLRTIFPHPAY